MLLSKATYTTFNTTFTLHPFTQLDIY
uniref:Uncharacterized protein n=1 Tax=Anguilla anguilla TaxID=7936 RepID=A0A0E9W8F5_ANGAN